ncbi:MAG: thermonuclease family protein [Candidatus Cloacimonas acidaminovorans]
MYKSKIPFNFNILMNPQRLIELFLIFTLLLVSSCKTHNSSDQNNIAIYKQPQAQSILDSQKVIKNGSYSLNQIFVLNNTELQKAKFKVIKIYDGDTITISDGTHEIRVRLIGIDTPEMNEKNPILRNLANQAKDYLSSLILNQFIYLQLDHFNEKSMHLDKFGRLLAYVYLFSDNLFVNAQMMRMGFSQEYEKYSFEQLHYFRKLAAQAKAEKLGIWALINSTNLYDVKYNSLVSGSSDDINFITNNGKAI